MRKHIGLYAAALLASLLCGVSAAASSTDMYVADALQHMGIERLYSPQETVAAAPRITVVDKLGKRVPLKAVIGNGRPTLIAVHGYRCGSCARDMAEIHNFVQKCGPRFNAVFIASSMMQRDVTDQQFTEMVGTLERHNIPWGMYKPLDFDSADVQKALGASKDGHVHTPLYYVFGSRGLPFMFFGGGFPFDKPQSVNWLCSVA